jgi:hypothetical protein
MSGARWVCFCGSKKIEPTSYDGRTLRRGHWRIFATCIDCGRQLQFTKWGMGEIGVLKEKKGGPND